MITRRFVVCLMMMLMITFFGVGTKAAAQKKSYTNYELKLLSSIIYCEAGWEPYSGKVAVGAVIMNRVKSSAFPNTIKSVIYQKNQFSPASSGALRKTMQRYNSGKFTSKGEKDSIRAAKKVLKGNKEITYKGKALTLNRVHYFNSRLRGAKLKIAGHAFK